mgnify:CR=1 FL=1
MWYTYVMGGALANGLMTCSMGSFRVQAISDSGEELLCS